jgi:hypothetical protein
MREVELCFCIELLFICFIHQSLVLAFLLGENGTSIVLYQDEIPSELIVHV